MHGVLQEWPQGSNAEHTHATVGFIGTNAGAQESRLRKTPHVCALRARGAKPLPCTRLVCERHLSYKIDFQSMRQREHC